MGTRFGFILATCLLSPCSQLPGQQDKAIRDFVHTTYIEGVPYLEATRFTSAAVPTLLTMLSDTTEQQYWPNIVVTIGMIGTEKDADSLISFIHSGDTHTLDPQVYRAKRAAVIALGYVANRNPKGRAARYLIDGADPRAWPARVRWTSPFHKSAIDRDLRLAQASLLGLALSGTPEAEKALRGLAQHPDTTLRRRVAATVETALREHAAMAREGLVGYHKKRDR
jgi:HEAT repeat protein